MKYLIFASFLICSLFVNAQNRVIVDGDFSEWTKQSSVFTDAAGDGGNSGVDFKKAQISNDEEYLFLYIETGSEINLQDLNDVAVYIDIDNNSSTGNSENGIGAELVYNFGDRSGTFHSNAGGSTSIRHRDISLITAPTVTSDRFEIGIKRQFEINGNTINLDGSIKIVYKDNSSNGDVFPSTSGGLNYSFVNNTLEPLPTYSIEKVTTSDFRIMSYNVERDGLFESSRASEYSRIFKALQPDIIGFQEIYNHTSKEVADKVESMLPSGIGEQWYHAMAEPDCHAISKYPILKSAQIPGSNGSGNGAFLVDIPNSEVDMLLIVAHPPCCTNNAGRQIEVDEIMKFVREAKAGNGSIPLKDKAPIVILGDMNFVGDHQQLTTLLTGDIVDEATYGSDFTPDWDGNDLLDCKPFTNDVPFSFTWYSESSSFSPGRLDYMLYTGSNLSLKNTLTLFTNALPSDSLKKYNLASNDVVTASDHLPVIADFRLKNKSTVSNRLQHVRLNNLNVYPNPTKGIFKIALSTPNNDLVTIELVDGMGRTVASVLEEVFSTRETILSFNTEGLSSGTYYVKCSTTHKTTYTKLLVYQ